MKQHKKKVASRIFSVPFYVLVRRIINWLSYQFIYVGASSLHRLSHLFVPSSPLNSRRCRESSRKDLVDHYGGFEFFLRHESNFTVNGVYLSVELFKKHQLSLTHEKKELQILQALDKDGDTVILFLGNNEYFEEEDSKFRAKWYLLQGKNVLMFNYPGYGDSCGKPSHQTTDAAAHLIYNLICQGEVKDSQGRVLLDLPANPKTDKQIILHGYSLGGGIASRLAGQLKKQQNSTPRLLLDRTFDNIHTIALNFLPPFLRCFPMVQRALKEVIEENYDYDSVEFLKKYDKENLFIIHADFDELMFENAKRALNRAVEGCQETEGARVVNVKKDHNTEWAELVRHIRRNDQKNLQDLEVFLKLMKKSEASSIEDYNYSLSSWQKVKKTFFKWLRFFLGIRDNTQLR